MERKQASDYPQELLNLFDRYVHGGIDRRGFLDGAARFAVGGMTAAMLLDELSPKFAEAQQVPSDDKRLNASYVEYDFVVINDEITGAVDRLRSIVVAERARLRCMRGQAETIVRTFS